MIYTGGDGGWEGFENGLALDWRVFRAQQETLLQEAQHERASGYGL